ncbi:MAG TPA: hypothetical protein VN228_01505 [Pyrinomonadaceae bacterium]|nr:hypothetical protein [Pyrinomonadaceae bacterium]
MSVRSSQIRVEVPAGGRRAARLVGAEEFAGRLPVDAVVEGGRPLLKWLDAGGARFDEPFFEQTVERVRRERPGGEEWFTDFDALVQLDKNADARRPDGFIFHSSRCGSTLVANACRALDGAGVVSEAAAVDKLVWPYLAGGGATLELLGRVFLRAAVNLFARHAGGRRFFVKFSCCSVLRLSFVRGVWQDVPWLFVHRDPVEVMVSNLRNPPDWMRRESQPELAAAVTGAGEAEAARMRPEEFCARALGGFYAAAADAEGGPRMLVGYEELSAAKLEEVVRFFGVTPTPAEAARVEAVRGFYAKDAAPSRRFEPDGEEKRAAASPAVREAAERWAAAPYRRLLSLRGGRR